jgi:hypothetical protein
MGSNYGLLLRQRIFMPATSKYTLARVTEKGRRRRAFESQKIWSVTYMELEEVLILIISLEVVNKQISF